MYRTIPFDGASLLTIQQSYNQTRESIVGPTAPSHYKLARIQESNLSLLLKLLLNRSPVLSSLRLRLSAQAEQAQHLTMLVWNLILIWLHPMNTLD